MSDSVDPSSADLLSSILAPIPKCTLGEDAENVKIPFYVKDLAIPEHLVTLTPDHTLKDAALTMLTKQIRHIPIVSNIFPMKLVGILSERDVRLCMDSPVLNENKDVMASLSKIKIKDAMTSSRIHHVTPSTSLVTAINTMLVSGVGALPVIDPSTGSIISIISHSDLLGVAGIALHRLESQNATANTSTSTS